MGSWVHVPSNPQYRGQLQRMQWLAFTPL